MATETVTRVNWTRPQTLAALHIYLQLPFGQLHQRNPKIKQLAQWLGRTPGSIALKLVNLASLDPMIVASGRAGMANASALDRRLWEELQTHWDAVALEAAAEYEKLANGHGEVADAELLETDSPVVEEGRSRSAIVQVRVNQARFRKAVLASYNATCCISGLRHEKLVIASHIVPWAEDTQNRLNPQNGLCLSALHDRAYDQGLITVLPDFTVRVSPKLKIASGDDFIKESLMRFDKQGIHLPERFGPSPVFLTKHAQRFGFM
jgi:predicted restriction endonuclease|nr:HNH endonuclease [Rhodoferax sp.]